VEEPVYPIQDLISDIGGTAGLFLGLSLVQIALLLKSCTIRGMAKLKNGLTSNFTRTIDKKQSSNSAQNFGDAGPVQNSSSASWGPGSTSLKMLVHVEP